MHSVAISDEVVGALKFLYVCEKLAFYLFDVCFTAYCRKKRLHKRDDRVPPVARKPVRLYSGESKSPPL